jgi:hypothetical protein
VLLILSILGVILSTGFKMSADKKQVEVAKKPYRFLFIIIAFC